MTIRKSNFYQRNRMAIKLSLLFLGLFIVIECSLFSAFTSARSGAMQASLDDKFFERGHKVTLVLTDLEAQQLHWTGEYDFEYQGISFHASSKQMLEDGGLVLRCEARACVKPEPVGDAPAPDQVEKESKPEFNVSNFFAPVIKGLGHLLAGFARC